MMLPCSVALLCVATGTAWAQAANSVDSGWILSKLAQPTPMRTNFVEVRSSRLLKNPLRLYGEYRRPDDKTMIRDVRAPYGETTTIRGDQVTIARAAKSPRTFSMSRAPQLAGMQASFGALLSGDERAIARDFTLTTTGTRAQWRMQMLPKQAALKQYVRDITLYGRGSELRCIETRAVKGEEVQRTLLASAARSVTAATTLDKLVMLCQQGS
nr:LolA-related protein [Lysobacter tolerans]